MLVGIPGSGKSTVAGEYASLGFRVHSSDAIREELYGSEQVQGSGTEVFSLLKKRLHEDLKKGNSCVWDATNTIRKYRIADMQDFKRYECKKSCVIVLASPQTCLSRNQDRQRTVPQEVIERMLRQFEVPYYYEGWDEIQAVCTEGAWTFPRQQAATFSQDSPYHTRTLGEHLDAVRDYCLAHGFSKELAEAGWYHDVGKLYTKTFVDKRGKESPTAHFYNHENYGTYLYLCEKAPGACQDGTWERTLRIATLINWHMRPLAVWENSPKAKAYDQELLGEEMTQAIIALHEADICS